ncbi:MAG: hypothetical protein R3Y50_07680 [Rikenellaceae bacterium]
MFSTTLSLAQDNIENSVPSWRGEFKEILPKLGHRNWILIVDSAYPLQSSEAIETLVSNENIEDVLKYVLKNIDKSDHIKPIVYQDKEFSFMCNEWSDDCEELRVDINKILAGYNPNVILHDEIFEKLDAASKLFNVLVIKTECTVPYSSVFVELDCGYWDSSSESSLRNSMK